MTRSSLLILFVVTMLGCQSMPSEHGKPVLVESRHSEGRPESFWTKTAEFLQPILPESVIGTSHRQVAAKPTYSQASYPAGSDENGADFVAFSAYKPSSQRLYRPGSIFPSQAVFSVDSLQETSAMEERNGQQNFSEAPAVASKPKKTADILKPQKGDSETFRRLLEMIGQTPRDERGVDDAELARLLERFREDMQEEGAEKWESNYLVILRKKILPNHRPSKKPSKPALEEETDEDDEEFQVRQERPTRARSKTPRYREEEDSFDDEEESDLSTREALALKSPKRHTDRESFVRKESPARTPAQAAAPLPPSSPPQPVYPGLTQLDGTTPVVTAQYQGQYGNPHDAGGHVVPVNYTAPVTLPQTGMQGSWEHHSLQAARMLRYQMEQSPSSRTFSNEARLRLLELVNGNRNEAVKPFTQVEKPFNEFWGNQVLGFSALMDELGNPDVRSRHINAAFRLDEGLMELRRLCPIRLKNVRLARDILAFGDYLPRSEECRAGEKIDVYLELENPTVRRLGGDFNVSISISYEIRDLSGNVIEKPAGNSIQSNSPGQRRDYFVHLLVGLPEELRPGEYQLRINVTDLNDESMQFAEEQISIKVMPTLEQKK